ncbi:MAG: T9SS type A sorting domain-containing protein [Bacteroidetes bacterium]|nr:T9SS type A sorting domain-containing protein [Bacteroidota bacterium]
MRMKLLLSIGLLVLSLSLKAQQNPIVGTTEKLVKLYPNPAVSYVVFELKNAGRKDLSLQVYNGILGKKMIDTKLNLERITFSLNEFTRGIYVYHLVESSGKIIESGKFQVTK